MAFKVEVVGFKDLEDFYKNIARVINPQSGISDSLEVGAWSIALDARDNAVRQGLFLSGALIDSIVPLKINQFRVDVIVGVIYGAIHEFGGTIPVTDKSRAFFWVMFKKTGDEKWKFMAISKKSFFVMPARPYLRPAVDEGKGMAIDMVSNDLRKKIEAVV